MSPARPHLRPFTAALALLGALSLAGCGGSSPAAPSLVRVEVAPGSVQVARGASVGLSATAIWAEAAPTDVGGEAAWSSSDPAVAELAGHRVIGRALGTAVITAAWSGHTATALVTVTPAELVAVQVDPGAAFLAAGTTRRFAATGVYTDGTTADLTAAAAWSSSATATADLVAGAPTGTLRGAAPGTATLTATVQGTSGQAAITVGSPVLEALRVEPASAQVPVGLDATFTATGVYSDGTTADLTAEVLWSADGGVAFFPSASAGTVRGLAEGGPVQVQAMLPGAGAVGQAALTVTAATVLAVDVTPAAATLPRGLTRALAATAVYSDGHHADVTGQVTWSSSDPATATVSSAPASAGTVSAVAVGGPVAVTATLAAAGIAGHADVTVTAAAVTAVEVSPAVATVAAGRTVAFAATALLSDGTRQPATEDAAWTSADPALASVSNVTGARGLAAGLRAGGPLTVRAQLPGLATPGEASLTVSGAELVSLAVEPPALSLAAGTAAQLRATGRYSDGSVADLTGLVAWTSADGAVAEVGASAATAGRLQAVAAGGPVAVTARLPGGPLAATADVTVTPAVLVSLAVAPASARAPLGRGAAFTATGTFSDGTTQDLTRQVSWLSGDDAVATVSNAWAAAGFAQGRAEGGPVEIRAWFPGTAVSAAGAFSVDPPALVSLAVSPASASLPAGRTQQLQALGTFTDAVVRDLTAAATWASAAPATVAPLAAPGLFRAAAEGGPVAVTAEAGGLTAACAFAVLPPVVEQVTVSPPSLALEFGATSGVTATATFSDGAARDVSAEATWEATVPGVVLLQRVGAEQLVAGAWLGSTTVTAAYGGAVGSTSVTVSPALPVAVRLLPGAAAVQVGQEVPLRALATYADGTVLDVTLEAAWSSGAPGVATVPSPGRVRGLSAGPATVTATLGASGSAPVTVTAGPPVRALASLTIEGAGAPLQAGGAAQLRATGWYDDGAITDLTAAVAWSSADPGVAPVDAAGLALGLATGRTTVTALHGPSGLSASATLAVTGDPAAEVVALGLEGPALAAPNAVVQLRAVGHLPGGATVDLTEATAWVPLSGATSTPGAGRFQASPPALRVVAFWRDLRAELTVPVAPAPDALRAVPSTLRLSPGQQAVVQLVARTTGAEPEEDAAVGACTSSAPAVISCEPFIQTPFQPVEVPGMLGCDAGALGTATLTCSAGGRTAQVAVTVSVSPPAEVITDLFIRPAGWFDGWQASLFSGSPEPLLRAPAWPALRPGGGLGLELVAITDAGQVTAAAQAEWTSTDPRIAGHVGDGLFQARAAGRFAALASLGDVTASARLVVLGAPDAAGLFLSARPSPIVAGDVLAIRGLSAGPDGTTDLTDQLAWRSSDPSVASFSADGPGVLFTHAAGAVTVTATARDGSSATLDVTVIGVATLRLVPSRVETSPGVPFGFAAIARLSDGTPRLVNDGAAWSIGDPSVLESLDQFQPGAFLGLGPGATRVEAALGALSAGADVVLSDAPAEGVLDAVAIRDAPILLVGQEGGIVAEAWYTDGRAVSIGPGWTVTTSDPAVVAILDGAGQPLAAASVVVDGAGLTLRGLAEGVATLTVTDPTGAMSDGAPAFVTTVQSLVIRPGAVSVPAGGTAFLQAVGIDGLGRELGVAATWSVADPAVAGFIDPGSSDLQGVAQGTTTVTAEAFGLTATAPVEVTAPRITSLTVEPGDLAIELGQSVALQALGLAGDASRFDVTGAAAWTSLDPAVAAFQAPGAPGRLTGVAVGEAAVVATLDVDGRTVAGPGRVSIRASLQSLEVAVGSPILGAGSAVQAVALATWGDGSQPTDATSWVTWASSDDAVIAPSAGRPAGTFDARSPGAATLTASSPSGVVGAVEVQVLPPFPVRLEVSAAAGPGPYPVGELVELVATATLSDGSTADVTAEAQWGSGIDGLVEGAGQVRVLGYPFGPLFVQAALATPAGPITGEALLEVVPPVIFVGVSSLPTLGFSGDTFHFTVIASRIDGFTTDVTPSAVIAFSPGVVATPGAAPGEVVLTGSGLIEVSATYEGVTGFGQVDVFARPVSLAIVPAAFTVEELQTVGGSAVVTLSDGSTQDVTSEAQWSVADPFVAFAEFGQVSGTSFGATEVAVIWQGPFGPLFASAPVTVTPRPIGLVVTPNPAVVGVGEVLTLTAQAQRSDGSSVDVTAETVFFPFSGLVQPGPTPGTFVGFLPGFSGFQAEWNGLVAGADLEVVDIPLSLAISPPDLQVGVGQAVPIQALAAMASGFSQVADSQVTWSSDAPGTADVEPGFEQWFVVGFQPGSTTLRATWTVLGHRVDAAATVTVVP